MNCIINQFCPQLNPFKRLIRQVFVMNEYNELNEVIYVRLLYRYYQKS